MPARESQEMANDRPAIRALGDALVEDGETRSPVSYLAEAQSFPDTIRLPWYAFGVMWFPFAIAHNKILDDAKGSIASDVDALHGDRDKLYKTAGNWDAVELENTENVRRI
ncbi:hypothetical protein [Nonomuraea sp. NPDC049400]|uniref:hypothetical protein n=1 Tax=Nonomuraea sp. NPDC049400 TaxID=3364352 RepID=UPI0037AB951F